MLRWIFAGCCVMFALFCVFGFIASGEADGAREVRWKTGYAFAGIVAMGGAFLVSRHRPGPD